jgi:hypothetical protein
LAELADASAITSSMSENKRVVFMEGIIAKSGGFAPGVKISCELRATILLEARSSRLDNTERS